MKVTQRRRLLRFLGVAEPAVNALGLLALVVFTCSFFPLSVLLSGEPATGGDTASHFWPLHALVNYGLPEWRVRMWNPGNLAGEPLLVHYFPFPYLIMAVLAQFLPEGMAFNWGTILPVLTLPVSVFLCLHWMRQRFPVPLLGAAASLLFLFNESYSMWGGNILSMLAGQFAHCYALTPFFLGIGLLCRSIERERLPLGASLCFTAVVLSHGYVFIGLPVVVLAALICVPFGTWKLRLRNGIVAGVLTALMSAWWLIPMLRNNRWTTEFKVFWRSPTILAETMPPIFYPVIGILAVALPLLLLTRWIAFQSKHYFFWARRPSAVWPLAYFLVVCPYFFGLYWVLPKLGLVDIRGVPQVQLLCCVLAGIVIAMWLARTGRVTTWVLAPCVLIGVLWFVQSKQEKVRPWSKWNYSSWGAKQLYPTLKSLSKSLQGDFSDPRVVYEHSLVNEATGTIRVFEMIPYFMNRGTLESVYLQASVTAPEAFYLQALVSKTPSCPFLQYKCTGFDLSQGLPKLRIMGVGDLILVSEELRSQAAEIEGLEPTGQFGPWYTYHLNPQPKMVEVIHSPLKPIKGNDWQMQFFDWFVNADETTPLQLFDGTLSPKLRARLLESPGDLWATENSCQPKVTASFNRLELQDACPGKVHVLKYSFHPTWKASTGDELFMVSPGFMALIPSSKTVTLEFGQSSLWFVCDLVSLVTLIVVGVLTIVQVTKSRIR